MKDPPHFTLRPPLAAFGSIRLQSWRLYSRRFSRPFLDFFNQAAILLLPLVFVTTCSGRFTVLNGTASGSHYSPVLRFPGALLNFEPIESARVLLVEDLVNGTVSFLVGNSTPYATIQDIIPGSIILISDKRPFMEASLVWQSLGARAIVIYYGVHDEALGFPEYNILLWNASMAWSVPIVNIKYSAAGPITEALRRGENVYASLTDRSGISPWRRTLSSPALFVFGTAEAAFSCVVAAVAFVKAWSIWVTQGRFIMQLPYACCFLEFVGGMIRFLYWGTDPLGSRFLVQYLAQQVWRTVSVPFCLSSTLLLTFYWHETVSASSLKLHLNVSRFKIPCYILIAIMFVVEIVVDILWLTAPDTGFLDYLTSILYFFVSISLSIFFMATAIRILLALRRVRQTIAAAAAETPKGHKKIFGIAIKVGITGLSLLIMVTCAVIFAAREFSFQMPTWAILWFFIHTSLNVKALSTVLAFTPSSVSPSSKSGGKWSAGTTNESRTSYLSSSGSYSLSRHSLA